MRARLTSAAFLLLAACEAKDILAEGETGESLSCSECDGPAQWPAEDVPVAIDVLDCVNANGYISCEVALFVPEGHPAEVWINMPGGDASGVPWNDAQWNADAGRWEDADLVGVGAECGFVSVRSTALAVGDWLEIGVAAGGWFDVSVVTIEANGLEILN